jgi:hypothetical protein
MSAFASSKGLRAPARRLAVFVLLAALASLSFGGSSASAGLRPLHTGVSYIYENDLAAFENARKAGVDIVQTPLRWASIAPEKQPAAWNPEDPADPNYDWEFIDQWVSRAAATGLTPVLQVRGAPLWAHRCHTGETDVPCNPDPAALAAFSTAAARRYSGNFGGLPHVTYWQGLNEPNLSLFFAPQFDRDRPVSPDLYRGLINSFYAAIKAVDPSNLVIGGGLGPIAVPKYTIGPMRFTRILLCMRGHAHPRPVRGDCGGGVHFDIFDIHPYTTGGPTHQGGINDVELGDIAKLETLLAAADRAGRIKGAFRHTPLWITELSWDSNPPDPGGLPMRILCRWTSEALFESWRVGVETFMWYSLRDGTPEPGTPSYLVPESGLFFRGPTVAQDQPKEVLFAYRFPLVAYPRKGGLFFWGRTPNSGPGQVRIQVQHGGGWRGVATVRADGNGMFQGLAKTQYGTNRKGAARARFAGGNSVPFSMRPVPDFRQPPFGAETPLG